MDTCCYGYVDSPSEVWVHHLCKVNLSSLENLRACSTPVKTEPPTFRP